MERRFAAFRNRRSTDAAAVKGGRVGASEAVAKASVTKVSGGPTLKEGAKPIGVAAVCAALSEAEIGD
jgi:hypothetical protein